MVVVKNKIKLLKQCKDIEQLRQVHGHIITIGLLSLYPRAILTEFLYSLTATLPASSSSLNWRLRLKSYALSIFDHIPCPSSFCFNTAIRCHALLSFPFQALLLFSQMRRLSVSPDSHTFPFALKASSQLPSLSLSQSLHSQALRFGFVSDVFVRNSLIHVYSVAGCQMYAQCVFHEIPQRDVVSYNALMDAFVRAGDIFKARQLFDCMPERDPVSWGTLLAGYARTNQCAEAIHLFHQMLSTCSSLGVGFRPDSVALVSAISACAQIGNLEQGKAIHRYIRQNGTAINAFLSTALVDFYAKCGCINRAVDIFERTLEKNLFTWNALLVGLAMHGLGQELLTYFKRMVEEGKKKGGLRPDGVTFLGVLVGCSHAGLIDEARKLFNEMESVYSVSRELKHYGCMADMLGRAGMIKEAVEMIKGMPMGGDLFVWGGLLGGCRIHGNVETAEKVVENVMVLFPEDGGVYKVMCNIYATAGRWDDVLHMRRLMDARRVKKNAGCSLIQLHGVTHEFVAGDTLHPQTHYIYRVLDAMGKHQLELH